MLHLYLIEWTGEIDYDVITGAVVCAQGPRRARQIVTDHKYNRVASETPSPAWSRELSCFRQGKVDLRVGQLRLPRPELIAPSNHKGGIVKKCLLGMLAVFALVACSVVTAGCGHSKAHIAAHNISVAADQFEVNRRITFINGITDKYLFVIEGACSVQTSDSALAGSLEVTCQVGKNAYCKDFLGLSDNVTYIIQQIGAINVGTAHYRVLFRPTSIIPNFSNSSGSPGLKVTGSCSGE